MERDRIAPSGVGSTLLHLVALATLGIAHYSWLRPVTDPVPPSPLLVAIQIASAEPVPTGSAAEPPPLPGDTVGTGKTDSGEPNSQEATAAATAKGAPATNDGPQHTTSSKQEPLIDSVVGEPAQVSPGDASAAAPGDASAKDDHDESKRLAAALVAAKPKFGGRHFVVTVDMQGVEQAGQLRSQIVGALESSQDLDRFLRGSAFVPSEDFNKLAVFLTEIPGTARFLIGSLKPGRFSEAAFLSERVNAGDAKGRALDFKPGRAGAFKALNWHFGVDPSQPGSPPDLCLLRAPQGTDFVIGSRADFASMGTFFKTNLASFIRSALATVPLRADRVGKVIAQLKGSRIAMLGAYGCHPDTEMLTFSAVNGAVLKADAFWTLRPELQTMPPDKCLKQAVSDPLKLAGLSGVAERVASEMLSPEVAALETNINADELKLFIERYTFQRRKGLALTTPVDERDVDYCRDALTPTPVPPPSVKPAAGARPTGLAVETINDFEVAISAPATGWYSLGELVVSARLRPDPIHGVPLGFRLFGVSPDSDLARLRFQNGDRIEVINGVPFTSEHQLSTRTPRLELKLLRRGQPTYVVINQRRKGNAAPP